jgi:hypothetical protein
VKREGDEEGEGEREGDVAAAMGRGRVGDGDEEERDGDRGRDGEASLLCRELRDVGDEEEELDASLLRR